ncbi:MAG TPA: hypothetical protein VN957_03375 [Chthoniobacterales bacterium]|jgi:hypothetical protein|nr:hypothetical protein [Chthoniobacterales bacterium]
MDIGSRFTVNVNCPPLPEEEQEIVDDETGSPIPDSENKMRAPAGSNRQ